MNWLIAKHLIKNKANVNRPDKNGDTTLDHAKITKNSEIIELLLENGAKANKDVDPNTAITSTATIIISNMPTAQIIRYL